MNRCFYESASKAVYCIGLAELAVVGVILVGLQEVRSAAIIGLACVAFAASIQAHRMGRHRTALCTAISVAFVLSHGFGGVAAQLFGPPIMVIVLLVLAAANGAFSPRFVIGLGVTMVTLWFAALWLGELGGGAFFLLESSRAWLLRVDQSMVLVLYAVAACRVHGVVRHNERQLVSVHGQVRADGRRDPLTGLLTRPAMQDVLKRETSRSKRSDRPFALAVVGVDDYTRLAGEEGDECAKWIMVTLSDLLRHVVRCEDRVARWDRERVMLLLRETDVEGAAAVARRVHAEVERSSYVFDSREIKFTLTLVITAGHGGLDLDHCAEELVTTLINAQASGGDRVTTITTDGP